MIRIQQIKVPVGYGKTDQRDILDKEFQNTDIQDVQIRDRESQDIQLQDTEIRNKKIRKKIRRLLHLAPEQAFTFQIIKQSIDARRGHEASYVYTVDVDLDFGQPQESRLVHQVHNKNIMLTKRTVYRFPKSGTQRMEHRPVIAGSGPAGLFCAYLLALHGYEPVILERGRMAEKRHQDVEAFWRTGVLDPDSNVQFGEGGAGTFSDGKLNTLVKDPAGRNRFVLETLVQNGADESILYVNKPHIGTDQLIRVVTSLRKEIIRLGGTFSFETCLTGIRIRDQKLCSVTAETAGQKRDIPAELLVTATGHSARDTFQMLAGHGIVMQAKAFAVGFRVEHPQEMINAHQYHGKYSRELPPASYKVTASANGRRGVYSFCMCPGGYVVNASSEPSGLAVNGMSYQKRDGSNANSAVIVSVTPDDFADGGKDPLGGIHFQRKLERRAYALGNGSIPQQLYGDYKNRSLSSAYGDFPSQAKGSCIFADLNTLLPEALRQPFLDGMEQFAQYIPDFNRYDAVLSGIESRTSSPVRILRNEAYVSSTDGIYPCGEGAGYAGGIMSAAMDGMKVAEAIACRYAAR